MIENGRKIRELTEAMRVERDIRIRDRVMVILGGRDTQGPFDKDRR